MGRFTFEFDQELVRQLERMEDYDNIAPKILDGAIPILQRRIVAECAKHSRTSTMLNSIKKTKAFKNKYGWFVSVRPTGVSTIYKDEKGVIRDRKEPVRNMEIMAYAEFGTSDQSPTPILTKALNDSKQEVADKMQEIFNEAVNG